MDDTAGSRDDSTDSQVELPDTTQQTELPLVFQCNKCRTILGDSTAWICGNEDLETISLRYVGPKVVVIQTLETATDGLELGSTFVRLTCENCRQPVGKMYKATPNHLDHIRNAYTLSVHAIDSFQTGSADQKASDVSLRSTDDLLTVTNAKFLYAQILKSQKMVVDLHKKIAHLENRLAKGSSNGGSAPDSQGDSYSQNNTSGEKSNLIYSALQDHSSATLHGLVLGKNGKENTVGDVRKRKLDEERNSPSHHKLPKRRSKPC